MIPLKVVVPLAVMFVMLTRFPLLSILWVPAPAPVLIPVVPFNVVPVMVFVVLIVAKTVQIRPVC